MKPTHTRATAFMRLILLIGLTKWTLTINNIRRFPYFGEFCSGKLIRAEVDRDCRTNFFFIPGEREQGSRRSVGKGCQDQRLSNSTGANYQEPRGTTTSALSFKLHVGVVYSWLPISRMPPHGTRPQLALHINFSIGFPISRHFGSSPPLLFKQRPP